MRPLPAFPFPHRCRVCSSLSVSVQAPQRYRATEGRTVLGSLGSLVRTHMGYRDVDRRTGFLVRL